MPTFRRIRRTVAALLLVLYLPACYHYVTPEGMTPEAYVAARQPPLVRLTLEDTVRLELLHPSVLGDSLVGARRIPVPQGGYREGEPLSVPIGAVRCLEVRKLNGAASVVGVAAALATGVLAAAVLVGLMGAGYAELVAAVDCELNPLGCR